MKFTEILVVIKDMFFCETWRCVVFYSYRSSGEAAAASSLNTQTMETLGYMFLEVSLSRGHDSCQGVMACDVIGCHQGPNNFQFSLGVLVLSCFILRIFRLYYPISKFN